MWFSSAPTEATLTTPAPRISTMAELLSISPQCDRDYTVAESIQIGLWPANFSIKLFASNLSFVRCADFFNAPIRAGFDFPAQYLNLTYAYSLMTARLEQDLYLEDGVLSAGYGDYKFIAAHDAAVREKHGIRFITDGKFTALFCGTCKAGELILAVHSYYGMEAVERVLNQISVVQKNKSSPLVAELCPVRFRDISLKQCALYLPGNPGLPKLIQASDNYQTPMVFEWLNASPSDLYSQLFSNITYRTNVEAKYPLSDILFNATHLCYQGGYIDCIERIGDDAYRDTRWSPFLSGGDR